MSGHPAWHHFSLLPVSIIHNKKNKKKTTATLRKTESDPAVCATAASTLIPVGNTRDAVVSTISKGVTFTTTQL